MTPPGTPHSASAQVPEAGEPSIPELEEDQTVPPRPEEELADVVRAEPDVSPHRTGDGGH